MPIAKSCIVCNARTADGSSRCERHANRGHTLPRGCIRCGEPGVKNGDYCDRCEPAIEAERQARRIASGQRDHYAGSYQTRAEAVRRKAYATGGPCMECGEGTRRGDPWVAGHVNDGEVDGPLGPAHRSCNIGRENRRRAARR